MTKVRKCNAGSFDTGKSKCPIDLRKVIGALIVPKGTKLPKNLTGVELERLCHADSSTRVRPIFDFVEYAPNGGEAQVSAIGYGSNKNSGISARTDTFTMGQYSEHIASALTKAMNTEVDVYYVDENFKLYGVNDGTDVLAGYPMSTIYHGGTPHPTSSAPATQTINFCHKDARKAIEDFDYEILDFDPRRFAIGLVPVKFLKVGDESSNKYKIVEVQGGFDRTPEFGAAIADAPTSILVGTATGVTYNEVDETITIAGTPKLKTPADLYEAGIKGIIGV